MIKRLAQRAHSPYPTSSPPSPHELAARVDDKHTVPVMALSHYADDMWIFGFAQAHVIQQLAGAVCVQAAARCRRRACT